MHKAMWWAQQSGMFAHHQQQEFHELLRMLQVAAVRCARSGALRSRARGTERRCRVQSKAVSTKNVVGDRKIDEGAFGSIESASRLPCPCCAPPA